MEHAYRGAKLETRRRAYERPHAQLLVGIDRLFASAAARRTPHDLHPGADLDQGYLSIWAEPSAGIGIRRRRLLAQVVNSVMSGL